MLQTAFAEIRKGRFLSWSLPIELESRGFLIHHQDHRPGQDIKCHSGGLIADDVVFK